MRSTVFCSGLFCVNALEAPSACCSTLHNLSQLKNSPKAVGRMSDIFAALGHALKVEGDPLGVLAMRAYQRGSTGLAG